MRPFHYFNDCLIENEPIHAEYTKANKGIPIWPPSSLLVEGTFPEARTGSPRCRINYVLNPAYQAKLGSPMQLMNHGMIIDADYITCQPGLGGIFFTLDLIALKAIA